jgi:hypothetical protein
LSFDAAIGFLGRSVPFDLDGKGAHPLDWPAAGYPFLALDLDKDGVITSGTELFGTATLLLATHASAPNGFAALAQYDLNGDGVIDGQDAIFSRLLLWYDRNGDGVCQPTELERLGFAGVGAIHLNAEPVKANGSGNAFLTFKSTFDEEYCSPAAPMLIADVWFRTSR